MFLKYSKKNPAFLRERKPWPQYATRVSEKFDIRIEFVPYTVNTLDVVGRFWCDLEFATKIADVIVDCPVGVVVEIFMPYKVNNHVIGENPMGIHDE